jgi:hypothetical protein
MEEIVSEESGIPLILSEADIAVEARTVVKAARKRNRILAANESAAATFFDALPAAVTKRLTAIVPPGFVLKEIEMQFSVKGEIFGTGIGGDVKAKFAPDPDAAKPQ